MPNAAQTVNQSAGIESAAVVAILKNPFLSGGRILINFTNYQINVNLVAASRISTEYKSLLGF